jgi:hypothetical protein
MNIYNYCRALLIASLLFSNHAAWSQIQNSLIGFQDIPWGTKINQVKNKYKNLKLIDQCEGLDALRSLAKNEDRSCKILTSDYVVDGTIFDKTFIFDQSQGLKRVELQRNESNYKNTIYTDDICDQLFKRIGHLLDSRYGPSVGVTDTEPRLFWGRSEYKAWLPLPSQIFIAKSFESNLPLTKKVPDHKGCEVFISYTPRISSQAKKL